MTSLLERYYLYMNNKKGATTVTLKITLKETLDASLLDKAVQTAIKRYPYFAVKICVSEEGKYFYEQNNAKIPVMPYSKKRPVLGSEAMNRHLVYVEYDDRTVYFSWFHGMCGSNGIHELVKTVLYEYYRLATGMAPESTGINLPDSEIAADERWMPSLDELNYDEPVYEPKEPESSASIFKFIIGLLTGTKSYEIEIDRDSFMKYAKGHDNSPASGISVLVAKTYKRLDPSHKGTILGYMAHSTINELGHPDATGDLVRSLPVYYSDELLEKSDDMLGTYTRTQVFLMSQPEYSAKFYKKVLNNAVECEKLETVKERIAFARKHNHNINAALPTFCISYVGQFDAPGIAEHIESIHTYTIGIMSTEINAVGNKIFLTHNVSKLPNKNLRYFCEELDRAGIKYQIKGNYPCVLPEMEYPEI